MIASLAGFLYGLAMLLLSRFLTINLGGLFGGISAIAGIAETKAKQVVQILGQLKTAHIVSPWTSVLLIGMAVGALYFF